MVGKTPAEASQRANALALSRPVSEIEDFLAFAIDPLKARLGCVIENYLQILKQGQCLLMAWAFRECCVIVVHGRRLGGGR